MVWYTVNGTNSTIKCQWYRSVNGTQKCQPYQNQMCQWYLKSINDTEYTSMVPKKCQWYLRKLSMARKESQMYKISVNGTNSRPLFPKPCLGIMVPKISPVYRLLFLNRLRKYKRKPFPIRLWIVNGKTFPIQLGKVTGKRFPIRLRKCLPVSPFLIRNGYQSKTPLHCRVRVLKQHSVGCTAENKRVSAAGVFGPRCCITVRAYRHYIVSVDRNKLLIQHPCVKLHKNVSFRGEMMK